MPATLFDIQRKYGDSVYPLYKDEIHEPYMENDNGIGIKGGVLYNDLEDKIQCSECGEWFRFLGGHTPSAHKITAREYKDKYELPQNIPLCTPKISFQRSQEAETRISNKNTFF